MAEAASLKWRVDEITICPICLEEYKNPVSLPCLHTFCMHCIEEYYKDKLGGDDVPCPVCRSEFKIPSTGVNGLPHNFFIQSLIDAKSASAAGQEVLCDVCLEDNDSSDNSPVATTYCVDCNKKLCEQCCKQHRKWTGGRHQEHKLGEEIQVEVIKQCSSYCEKHKNKLIEFYCFECKHNICTTCFIADHRQHDCREINEVAEGFLKQGDADLEPVLARIAEMKKLTERLAAQKSSFLDDISKTESGIEEKGEKVREAIDRQVTERKAELQSITNRTLKEIESPISSAELALTAMESFKAYFSELKAKGRPIDITRAVDSLHTRAVELLQTYRALEDYHVPQVTFTPMNLDELTTGSQNFIGCVDINSPSGKLQLRTHKERELEKKCEDFEIIERDLQEQLKQALEGESNLKEQLKISKENEDKVQSELKVLSEREKATQSNLKQSKDELKVLSDKEQIERNKSKQLENGLKTLRDREEAAQRKIGQLEAELKTVSDKEQTEKKKSKLLEDELKTLKDRETSAQRKMSQVEEELRQALQREAELKQKIISQQIEDQRTTQDKDEEETTQHLASDGSSTDDRYAEICRRSVVVGPAESWLAYTLFVHSVALAGGISSLVRRRLEPFGVIEQLVDIDSRTCLVVFQDVSAAERSEKQGNSYISVTRPTLETVKRHVCL